METKCVKSYKVTGCNIENYSYIIYDSVTHGGYLIDPAWHYELLRSEILRLNIDLKGILITHCHYDHINLVNELQSEFDTEVFVSIYEPFDKGIYKFEPTFLFGEEKLEFGDSKVHCIWTPGHTKGSTCFLVDDNLFTGDTLFNEGCGLCVEPEGCSASLFESIQKLKRFSDNIKIWPGHVYCSKIGKKLSDIMKINIYLHIEDKNDFIRFSERRNNL